jgi:hypothetical protein
MRCKEEKMQKERWLVLKEFLWSRIKALEAAGYQHQEGRLNLNLFESLTLKQVARYMETLEGR